MSNRYQQLPENKALANLLRLSKQQGSALILALFPFNSVAGVCNLTNVASYDFQTVLNEDIPGLYDCEAATTCDNYYSDTVNSVEYFRLTSTGKCGSGLMKSDSKVIVKSSRTIQLEARSL